MLIKFEGKVYKFMQIQHDTIICHDRDGHMKSIPLTNTEILLRLNEFEDLPYGYTYSI